MLLLFILLSYLQVKHPIFRPILTLFPTFFFLPLVSRFIEKKKPSDSRRPLERDEEERVLITFLITNILSHLRARASSSPLSRVVFSFVRLKKVRGKRRATIENGSPSSVGTTISVVPRHSVYVFV